MKFVPRSMGQKADASGSERGHLQELLRTSCWVLAILVILYLITGLAVDLLVPCISVETENRLFRGFIPAHGNTRDAALRPLRAILDKLAKQAEVPRLDYRLALLPGAQPNAFAFPGGTIGVTRGLMEQLGTQETAIAFVLGHELGHYRNRDHLRGLGRGIAMAICRHLVFGSDSAVGVLTDNSLYFMQRRYSRAQERRADRFGLRLVNTAYGRTEGAARLFGIIRRNHRLAPWAYMLATHPNPDERIAELQRYARELQRPTAAGKAH